MSYTTFDKLMMNDGAKFYIGQDVYYKNEPYRICGCSNHDGKYFSYTLYKPGGEGPWLHQVHEKAISIQPSLF